MIRDEQPHRTLNIPRLLCRLSLLTTLVAVSAAAKAQTGYVQSNLISDGSVPAAHTDPNLINPWGLSIGKDFWINSPGSGLSLVTDAKGNPSFNVSVPPAQTSAPHGTPAGTVFNPDTTAFIIPSAGSATFLFSTLDGTIAAWNASTPSAVTVANNSANKASYTDIAIDKSGNNTFLLAANFSGGTVDVFDTNFKATKLAGSFTDPQLPSGYSPFGIHTIGSKVYVTYAQLNTSNGREVVGAGLGYVDIFDLNGNFLQRAISQGVLNAPWGMALAPSTFGQFANDLLVGNFGDGTINAYDASSFTLQGTLQDAKGAPITNTGLWEIVFGVGSGSTVASAGDPNTLYIAAGINGAKGGVVAAITPVAGSNPGDFGVTAGGGITVGAGGTATTTLSLTGSNGFAGTVALSCSGLPTGAACAFNPSTVTLSGSTASPVTLSVTAGASTPPVTGNPYSAQLAAHHPVMFAAFAAPFAMLAFVGFRRRKTVVQGTLFAASLVFLSIALTGCASSSKSSQAATPPTTTPTPTTTQITVTATSGTLSHSIPVTLTIQ